ncbi:MAG: PIG-L deacetylase family protein [Mycobacterium sp.]
MTLSNASRFADKPLRDGGTPARDWIDWERSFPELDLTNCPGLVLVAPHPDDETLGFGATAALLRKAGVDVLVVSVTDGGAASPDQSPFDRTQLERRRRYEVRQATGILGLPEPISLSLPDGRVAEYEDQLVGTLTDLLRSRPAGTWCAATWRGDGHPDHEAVGRAAARAAQAVDSALLEYPIWMWHWAEPDDPDVPWDRASSVQLNRAATGRKQMAAQAFRSQFESNPGTGEPLIPAFVMRRLLAVGEVVFR